MTSNKKKEILVLLFKDFTTKYNARSISTKVGMTPRGALKALKEFEKQQLVKAEPFGKAIQYSFNNHSLLARKTIELFLLEEAEQKYKRWIEEFKKFAEAEILVLFGSATRNNKTYNDIDLLIVLKKENYNPLMKKIEEKNSILPKKIHPIIQTQNDIQENIQRKDAIILDAIRTGIVLKGWTTFVEVVTNVASK